MNISCSLTDKTCIPCEGGIPPLSHDQAENLLKELQNDDWKLRDDTKIERDFKFKNFKRAMAFINKVADLAESEGHHPDIFLHGWNRVKLTLSTHAIGGLSENDFILAAKINQLNNEHS